MPARRLSEILIAVALMLAGLGAGLSEARALISARAPGLTEASMHAGMAAESRQSVLLRCDKAMAGPSFALQATARRELIARDCDTLAGLVLGDAPSHGFAHLIAAAAAETAGDSVGMMDHLIASQNFAPQEGWLAERRFALISRGSPALQARLLPAEIATLIVTQAGAEMLARAIETPSPFRDIVLLRAAQASNSDRQRLINLVRERARDE